MVEPVDDITEPRTLIRAEPHAQLGKLSCVFWAFRRTSEHIFPCLLPSEHLLIRAVAHRDPPGAVDFPEEYGERPDVALFRELVQEDRLRCHPAEGDELLVVEVVVRGEDVAAERQTGDLDVQVGGDEHVASREIFVDEVKTGEVGHALSDLAEDRGDLVCSECRSVVGLVAHRRQELSKSALLRKQFKKVQLMTVQKQNKKISLLELISSILFVLYD